MAGKGAEAEGQAKDQQAKKSPLLMIIILVVLLAVLGGGGFFVYIKFLKKEPPAVQPKAPQVEENVSIEAGTYLVNLSDPGGKRYLKVTMQFELNGHRVSDEIGRRNVEMRDMIIMLLSNKEYNDIGTASGKLNLKRELIARLNKMLREGQVREIYFVEFLVQ